MEGREKKGRQLKSKNTLDERHGGERRDERERGDEREREMRERGERGEREKERG